MLDDEGRQRNPALLDYKLVTCADAPEIEVDWIQIADEGRRPAGFERGGRAAAGAHRRGDRQRDLEGARRPGATDAHDPRAGVGGGAMQPRAQEVEA